MTTLDYLEKARAGRRAALAALGTDTRNEAKAMSIFDDAFDDMPAQPEPANVIALRPTRPLALPHIAPRRTAA